MHIIHHFFWQDRLLFVLLPLLVLLGFSGVAQEHNLTKTVEKAIRQNNSQYVTLFKELYQQPELGF